MTRGDLAQALKITHRRDQDARRTSHGLDDDRRNGLGAMKRHKALEIIGKFDARLRLPVHEPPRGGVVGVAQMIRARQQRPKPAPVVDDAADRDAAKAHAMIAAFAADKSRSGPLPDRSLIRQGDLERAIHRLGTGVAEEDLVQSRRRQRRHATCELERHRMRQLERRRKIELAGLSPDRLDDALASVARVDAPQSGRAIEHPATVGRDIVHTLCSGEHPRLLFEPPVVGERQPEGFEVIGQAHALGAKRINT